MYDAVIVHCDNDLINNNVHSSVASETRTLSSTADLPTPAAPFAALGRAPPAEFHPSRHLAGRRQFQPESSTSRDQPDQPSAGPSNPSAVVTNPPASVLPVTSERTRGRGKRRRIDAGQTRTIPGQAAESEMCCTWMKSAIEKNSKLVIVLALQEEELRLRNSKQAKEMTVLSLKEEELTLRIVKLKRELQVPVDDNKVCQSLFVIYTTIGDACVCVCTI